MGNSGQECNFDLSNSPIEMEFARNDPIDVDVAEPSKVADFPV